MGNVGSYARDNIQDRLNNFGSCQEEYHCWSSWEDGQKRVPKMHPKAEGEKITLHEQGRGSLILPKIDYKCTSTPVGLSESRLWLPSSVQWLQLLYDSMSL